MKQIALSLFCVAMPLSLAAAQSVCPSGNITPDYGYQWSGCPGCLSSRYDRGVQRTVYLAPPSLHQIRPDGPAAGRLHEDDLLLAVDSMPIVSLAGLDRFETLRPGTTVLLTVQRGTDTINVAIKPLPFCQPKAAKIAVKANAPPITSTAWFGFGLSCGSCVARAGSDGVPRWSFPLPPVVSALDARGPAARAGLRIGDTLTTIDGLALGTELGGHRLRSARPGDLVQLTWHRDGRELKAQVRPALRDAALASTRDDSVRYRGTVGGASIDIRGVPVEVTTDPRTGTVTIHGGGLNITIRPPAGPATSH